MPAKRIIRAVAEELEKFGKTAAEQVVGVSEKTDTSKILPPEEKKKIKSQEVAMLRDINLKIAEIRKKREEKPQVEEQKKQIKKHEEKKKQQDKWAVLKNMIKNQQGSKESGNIRASG